MPRDQVADGAPRRVGRHLVRALRARSGQGRGVRPRPLRPRGGCPGALCDLVEVFTDTGVRRAGDRVPGRAPGDDRQQVDHAPIAGGVSSSDFHQDGAFLGRRASGPVDCWIALSHCGPGTGKPRSTSCPRDSTRSSRRARVAPSPGRSPRRRCGGFPDVPVVSPVFAPGDALFFDERLPHRTSVGHRPRPPLRHRVVVRRAVVVSRPAPAGRALRLATAPCRAEVTGRPA